MRLWQLLILVAMVAVGLLVARDELGRVVLVVFLLGLSEAALGVTALMTLFQTVGSLGASRTTAEGLRAMGATLLVLCTASAVMNFVFWFGFLILREITR